MSSQNSSPLTDILLGLLASFDAKPKTKPQTISALTDLLSKFTASTDIFAPINKNNEMKTTEAPKQEAKKKDNEKLDREMEAMLNEPNFAVCIPCYESQPSTPYDIVQDSKSYIVIIEAAGINKTDIKISTVENKLNVSFDRKKKLDTDESYVISGITGGPVKLKIDMPQDCNMFLREKGFEQGIIRLVFDKIPPPTVTEITL